MDAVRDAGVVVRFTSDQFPFVRAFYMAIPPVSHALPTGDKAFAAKDAQGIGVFGLYDPDGQVCAVFQSTDWMDKLVDAIGRGEVGKRGDGL